MTVTDANQQWWRDTKNSNCTKDVTDQTPDYFELKKVPGYFGSANDGALWLQNHKGDPYWMAHQLNNAASPRDYSHFEEFWQMARQIRGYEPL